MIAEAAHDRRVSAVVADRDERIRQGRSGLIAAFDVVRLQGATRAYVENELYKDSGFGFPITCEANERLLRFSIEHLVGKISPRPLFLAHRTANDLYSPHEAERLYELAGEPRELQPLKGAGHSVWMHDGHATLRRLIGPITDFIDRSVQTSSVGRPAPVDMRAALPHDALAP